MSRKLRLLAVLLVLTTLAGLCSATVFAAADRSPVLGVATVNAGSLNVRTGPGTEYDRVGSLSRGSRVLVLEQTSAEFTAAGVCIYCGAFVRLSPDKSGKAVTMLFVDTPVTVTGLEAGWYRLDWNGVTCYTPSEYLVLSDLALSDAPAPAEETDPDPEQDTPSLGQQIADYACQFVGGRYVYGGESPDTGFDCSGLMMYVYRHFGYSLNRSASGQYSNGRSVKKSQLQVGDLVFFSDNGGYSVTHVGMYIGDGKFVHASNPRKGICIGDLNSDYYQSVYYGARRIL